MLKSFVKEALERALEKVCGRSISIDKKEIEIPRRKEFGDFSYPCFKLTQELKIPPQELAERIKEELERIETSPLISRVENVGGYVNFFLERREVAELVLKRILEEGENFGRLSVGKGKVAVVEYSSPNPAHPIHIGTARTTLIGESLARMLEFCGYDVKRLCYINDLGKQVMVLLWGYLKFANGKVPDKKPDHWLLEIYVKANSELERNPGVEEEIQELLRRCEEGDEGLRKTLRQIVEWCMKGFEETYERLGIRFDEYVWESWFIEDSRKLVDSLLEKGYAFRTEEGSVVADLERFSLPNTVLLRKDGTGLYLTRDIAASVYKFEKYKPSLNVYVVAEEQKLHFKQLFKILELLGYEELSKVSKHVSYGMVVISGGKLSSRKGRIITLDELLDEAARKVREIYSSPPEVAEAVGKGAVVYSILKVGPEKNIKFDWKEALALEGNTGPYLQYTYARCWGILRKLEENWEEVAKEFALPEEIEIKDDEFSLVKKLGEFPETIEKALSSLDPSVLCNYAYELASLFAKFYESSPVKNERDEKVRRFRVCLVVATKIVLESLFKILIMERLERI